MNLPDAVLDWQRRTAEAAPSDPVDETSAFTGSDATGEIAAAVDGLRPELERLAIELHDDPEIGFEEHRAVTRIAVLLEQHGHVVERGAFGLQTAFRTTAGSGTGPQFALSPSTTRCRGSVTPAGTTSSRLQRSGRFWRTHPSPNDSARGSP